MEFKPFNKIPRLSKPIVITEKLDGTNAQVYISPEGEVLAGSRNRWLTVDNDNYGFAKWVMSNKDDLMKLGEGHHYGEWWGQGIQRKYNMDHKVFSLFNTHKWSDKEVRPCCCDVVPVLGTIDTFDTEYIGIVLDNLRLSGSQAAPGFMDPEGVVIYHTASGQLYKKTLKDDVGKHG